MRDSNQVSTRLPLALACLGMVLAAPIAATAQEQEAGAVPTFQVDPFWPKPLPEGWLLGQVAGVAVDEADRIWIIHRPDSLSEREVGATLDPPISKCCTPAPPVLVFDVSGNLLRHWGGEGEGYDWPEVEHGIYVDLDGFVWVGGNGENDH
jgi:hypothetical protein